MFPPKTPTKAIKADDEINARIQLLSESWSLQLHIRDASWSPSRNPVNSEEKQIYERVRWLYFKDEQALNYAVAEFERYASSNWVAKPLADPDVLLSRGLRPSTRNDFLKKRNMNDEEAAELRRVLFAVLKNITEKVKARIPYADKDILQEDGYDIPQSPLKSEHSPMKNLPKQPSIHDFFKKQTPGIGFFAKESLVKVQHPSSDEYPIEESDFLDLALSDAPEEKYRTPPERLPAAPVPRASAINPIAMISANSKADSPFRRPQPVSAQSNNRERSYPESTVPAVPQSVTREKRSAGYSRSHSANELGSDLPNYNYPIDELGRQRNSTSTALYQSFSSASTVSRTSSRTRPSTGFTTPNTSFNADSLTTSFDSANEADDPTLVSINLINDITSLNQDDKSRRGGEDHMFRDDLANLRPSISKTHGSVRSTSEPPGSSIVETNGDDVLVNMDIDEYATETEEKQPPRAHLEPTNERPMRIQGVDAEAYLEQYLFQSSPFAPFRLDDIATVPFRQVYEVIRIARACHVPLISFADVLKQPQDDYDRLWTALSSIAMTHSSPMPERSSVAAWKRAEKMFDCVGLSGGLKFSDCPKTPLLEFNLKPLKLESSYRLSRKFGGDRFCIISFPGLERADLPTSLRSSFHSIRSALLKWLAEMEHHFLGRKWRAFYVKPESTKKGAIRTQKKFTRIGFRIFFFAEDGDDITRSRSVRELDPRTPNHCPMATSKLMNWFMPPIENQEQPCLKFFARLALAVSSTKPTIEFRPGEIVRSDDAYADDPKLRQLDLKRSNDKKNRINQAPSKSKVMNDGCARISRTAAKNITEILGLDTVPSVFQGRISGAKGIWMVDALDETLSSSKRGYWIEITDSQLKFEGDPVDNLYPDSERVTFEVQSYSRKLSTAALNFQLMPILEDRGVPFATFRRLLEEDLTAKVGELEVAMDSPLALRKWNQENNPVTEERLSNKGIEMVGGIPNSASEQINWFVEHGFEPRSCRTLKEFLYTAIKDYCLRLENRMNIELGKSTYAFMIADPLAILEENEVHVGFSSMFRDTKSGWSEVMLHDMDILVARLPALLSSDIQKVRAVFKPELRNYRDVIVFSSKGECSLANKLSGGDYDGDRAWICWEPSIVEPFTNASVPDPIALADYGIAKDTLKVSDILPLQDYTNRLLLHAFDFNLRVNMLGTCTTYHEALCYHEKSISSKYAVEIAILLGYLVDRAKAGITFDEPQWNAYKKSRGLKTYSKPAYKDKDNARPKNHLIDNLVFTVAKSVRQDALGKFDRHFPSVGTEDEDLVRLWLAESKEAERDSDVNLVLYDLKNKLRPIFEFWRTNSTPKDDRKEASSRKGNAISFRARVEKCRADFLAIEPPAIEGSSVIRRWKHREKSNGFARNYWDLLKASALYHEWHRIGGNFPWYTAGVELGELKATTDGKGSYRILKENMFEAFKLDYKVVKRRQELDYGRLEEEEDEFGDFDWDDIEV